MVLQCNNWIDTWLLRLSLEGVYILFKVVHPENLISRIKAMAPRERGKLLKDDLTNLILQILETSVPTLENFNALSIKVEGLENSCSFFQSQVVDNSASIWNLEKLMRH